MPAAPTTRGSSSFIARTPSVSGRVTGDGKALANAQVRCVWAFGNNYPETGPDAQTDDDGRFAVTCADQDQFKIQALHPRWQTRVSGWLTRAMTRTQRVTVELKRGARLTGIVYDVDGKPAPDVALMLFDPEDHDQPRGFHDWIESRLTNPTTPSNEHGEFSFESAPVGKLHLVGQAHDRTAARVRVELSTDRDVSGELHLSTGEQVSGTVTLDGAPVAGVMVAWQCNPHDYPLGLQLSGPDGAFHMNQLTRSEKCAVVAKPAGENSSWNLRGARAGFLPTQVHALTGQTAIHVDLRTERPGELTIVLVGALHDYSGSFLLTGLDEDAARPGASRPRSTGATARTSSSACELGAID